MFSKTLLKSALLALSVYAQDAEETETDAETMLTESELAEKYPEWAAHMTKNYPAYTWEAYEVPVAGAFTKTLFHITGSADVPDFKPRMQPVLLVNGGTTNSITWINTLNMDATNMTKEQYAGQWETGLLQLIKDEDPLRLTVLSKLKAATEKNRWVVLSDYWREK